MPRRSSDAPRRDASPSSTPNQPQTAQLQTVSPSLGDSRIVSIADLVSVLLWLFFEPKKINNNDLLTLNWRVMMMMKVLLRHLLHLMIIQIG